MSDVGRTFMYHGAEHKCINCVEHGMSLTADNVMNSSRLHKRCGTSFLFLVMFISIIFFIFIRIDNTALQVVIRLLLIPVVAGVSYEVLRAAGKNDKNKFLDIVSRPGLWLQKLTTKEPDRRMVEVAICAVEAVFDWREFVREYHKDDEEPFTIEESSPEDFVTDEERQEEAEKRQKEYKEVLERRENASLDERYAQMAESMQSMPKSEGANTDSADAADDIFTFEDENGQRIAEPVISQEEPEDGDFDGDDGIIFDEDTDDEGEEELFADDVPVFKQRKKDN
jgi:hypothetical protein